MYKNRNPISATATILTVLLEYIGLFNFNQFKQIIIWEVEGCTIHLRPVNISVNKF